jgi:hypothetical protein
VRGVAKGESRKTSSELGLDLAARDRLTAAAFDANCFSYGRPDLEQLRYLARRLVEIDIEAWVPEPVAWEWAQHIGEDWDAIRVRLGDENKRVKKAGLASFESSHTNTSAVAEAFLAKLAEVPHVVLIPLSADNAREGLRDQILQRPPGRRKDGIKTGASDSAWLRDVLYRVGGDVTRVLFVSDDKDLRAALSAWGKEAPLMRPLKDLLATLFIVTVDTGAATQVLLRYVLDNLPADQGTGVLDVGAAPGLQSIVEYILNPSDADTRVDNVTISKITQLAGIVSVTMESTHEADESVEETGSDGTQDAQAPTRGMYGQLDQKTPHTVMATLMLLADAEAAVSRANADDRYVTSVATIPDILLRASMVFDLEAGKVVAARTEGETAAFSHQEGYESEEEALEELAEAITETVPGLNIPDGWLYQDDHELEKEINNHAVRLNFSVVDFGAWELEVQIDDEAAKLSCNYDVGARVWLGREDSFDMPGAYRVELNISSSPNPIWALVSWIIEQLYR